MNSAAPFTSDPVIHQLAEAAERVILDPPAAANDRLVHRAEPNFEEAPEESDGARNPLWIVVAGIACLVGAMAAVMALT